MSIDFDNDVIMGCIPIEDLPQAPKDQQKCEEHPCQICDKPMWVSEFKRAWIADKPNRRMYCFRCIIAAQLSQGINPRDTDITDAKRMQ